MEKDYWENYYKTHRILLEPSLFAKHVLKHHIKPKSLLVELGCGNGRDAIFFAYNNVKVLAIDQCEKEISYLAKINKHNNLRLLCSDFTRLDNMEPCDTIYSRFTLHSIDEEGENRTIDWAHNHLNNGGKILIEARGHKNELHGLGQPVEGHPNAYIHDDHYRRFINLDEMCEKLKTKGFDIFLAEEKSGFAPFRDTDHVFIRIIAIKK